MRDYPGDFWDTTKKLNIVTWGLFVLTNSRLIEIEQYNNHIYVRA